MPKSLIVVESPTKVKTITKFLGSNYTVKASGGHVRDLPQKKLSVDIENGFKPDYVIIDSKKKYVKQIKEAAKKASNIFLATDPDREGEAIGWHLAHELKNIKKPIKRITFNEITRDAVQEAIKKPGKIDQKLVDAQQARRVLDRLVGYQISPILGRTIKWGLSAGRVQSVAVRLICEREAEIESFIPEEYWSITAKLKGDKTDPFEAKLNKIGKKKAKVENEGQAKTIVKQSTDEDFIVDKIQRKERKRRPVPPFITSRLQQEAARKLRFTARKTMVIAQQLYEGLEIGDEGMVGLITYMRTDSTRVASEAINAVRDFISEKYGSEYLPGRPVTYKSRKGAQDAHEAIRPTSIARNPEDIKQFLNKDQLALYDLIWKRFVASQMKPALLDVTTIDIKAGKYIYRATGSIIKFQGFMSVYLEGKDDSPDDDKESILPELKQGQILELLGITPQQHFTQPPHRYSEATLVKALEEKGIGRPSTYASIISTIQSREYVIKEKNRFIPTEMGKMVNLLLVESFPEVLDVEFTARMESELDDIEDGKRKWVEVLEEFYGPFSKYLEKAPETIRSVKKDMEEVTDEVCEQCGKKMVIKWGRFGKFLACSGYPECRNTRELDDDEQGNDENNSIDEVCEKCGSPMVVKVGRYGKFLACSAYPDCKNTKQLKNGEKVEDEPTDEVCEKCGSPMVIKTGRYGRFMACSKYPKCKTVKSISIGIDCPQEDCDGYLTERRGRGGRPFYGCSNYPDCKFAVWNKPVDKKCPECGAPFLVEKTTKAKGEHLACYNKECSYTEPKNQED
ncbi:type I DNA topoisomerase [Candidatus Poribacteria bacterium]|nr:type I DNA topoisomerase [Candidatus Poribacteria bacterium]